MIHKITLQNHKKFLLFICLTISIVVNAQIGIGTTTPNVSSILDITSTTKGMLAPRVTTAQRLAIALPADGLLVYDVTLKLFYYYNSTSTSWTPMNSSVNGRNNFKRIKSTDVLATVLAEELTDGGGAKYKLKTNTLYEINGAITLDKPIDLNNAYIQGLDSGDDKIIGAGNIFDGNTGGGVKNVTLSAPSGQVFNLTGTGNTENLIFRDCIVAGSANVGSISGFGLVFLSIIQFSGNTTGITYSNISQLLLSNLGWFGTNLGTFEKLNGTFTLVQKQGGFSQVNGSAVGFDVSSNPTINGDAVLESVVFTGSNTGGYVNPYPLANRYQNFNFSNSWTVDSAGIPREGDSNAAGDFGVDYSVGSGIGININNSTTQYKIPGVSESSNLFRFSSDGFSKLTYLGKKNRIFQISGSISFQVPALGTYIIYLAKNGVMLTKNKVYGKGSVANDIIVLPLNGLAELKTNDYLEVYIQRYSGSNGQVVIPNMSITVK